MKTKKFYHYTKFVNQIKKDKKLLASSYPKTNTYDFVLDFCPEVLLNRKGLKRLKDYKLKNKKKINRYRNEWKRDFNYFSAYRNVKLDHINKLLNKFFSQKWYILAFTELFERGWIKVKEKKASSIFLKIGNKCVIFTITDKQFKKSFVLNQKYWLSGWMNKLMNKKYGKNWWRLYQKYDKIFYKDFKELDKKGNEFMTYFAKNTFGKYYLSVKSLSTYKKNSFKTPEYWIYGDVPVSKCEFEEVDFKTFQKMTGYGEKDLKKRGIRKYDYALRKRLR